MKSIKFCEFTNYRNSSQCSRHFLHHIIKNGILTFVASTFSGTMCPCLSWISSSRVSYRRIHQEEEEEKNKWNVKEILKELWKTETIKMYNNNDSRNGTSYHIFHLTSDRICGLQLLLHTLKTTVSVSRS